MPLDSQATRTVTAGLGAPVPVATASRDNPPSFFVAPASMPIAQFAQPVGHVPAGVGFAPRAIERVITPRMVPVLPMAPALPREPLFRKVAVDAHHAFGQGDTELPKPSGYSWAILSVITSLVVALLVGAAIASIEVTVAAPGALRAAEGLRSVESSISGSVAELLVNAGDQVVKGQVVVRLDAAELAASREHLRKQLSELERQNAEAELTDERLGDRTRRALLNKRGVLQRRATINRDQHARRKERLNRVQTMVQLGAASRDEELSAHEATQDAAGTQQSIHSGLADIDLELAELSNRLESQALARRTALSKATAALAEVESLVDRAEIRAPMSGRVESLLVKAGAVVQPGKVLAQVVPAAAPRAIVAFVPSREIAFVGTGSRARVEVESLPVAEFGVAQATVTRISADVAKPEEIAAVFSEPTPGSFVRVELVLEKDPHHPRIERHIRSGERVIVKIHRREQRVLSLMFEFARKWLGQ